MKELTLRIRNDAFEFARWAAARWGYDSPEDYLIAALTGAVLDDMHRPEDEDASGGVRPAADIDDDIPF